jgi:hypothetical protein
LITKRGSRNRTAAAVSFPLLLLLAAPVLAQQPWVGPRAIGMAGAQTGAANDATALWSNPAGLGVDPKLEFNFFGGAVGSDRNNFVSSVDFLAGLDPSTITPQQLLQAIATLNALNTPGTGLIASGVAGLAVAESGLAIGVGDVAYAAVYPMIDLTNTTPETFPDNQTGVNSIGLEARELRVGYSYGLYGRTLLIGAAARYIVGRTYYAHTSIFDLEQDNLGSMIVEALKANSKNTNAFTFDVGVMLNIIQTLRIGIVGQALTEPKFDVKQESNNATLIGAPAYVRLPRTVRIGGAFTPISILTIAADYDLMASNTLLPGGKSRQFSGGVEVKLPIVSLRGGAFIDFESPNQHWSYSAGAGLNLSVIQIDVAGVLSESGGFHFTSPVRKDIGASAGIRIKL